MSGTHLTGVLTVADSINTNGRCYPKSILKSEAQRFHREEILKAKGFGDLDHPQYFSSSYSIVDPTTASHQVIAIWWRGAELHGIVRLLNSEAAQKAKEIVQNGGRLGASTRCWSSLAVNNSGTANVHKDCRLITFDLTEQSATGLFLRPVLAQMPPMRRSLEQQQQENITRQQSAAL